MTVPSGSGDSQTFRVQHCFGVPALAEPHEMGRETGYGFLRIYLEENASEKTYVKNRQLNLYGLIEGKER